MKKLIFISLGLGLTLSACNLPALDQTQLAVDVIKVVVPAKVVADMQNKCRQMAPVLAVATSSAAPKIVATTASYAGSYCQQLNSGVVPPTTDANTPSWFDKTLTVVASLAKVAMFVLPLI